MSQQSVMERSPGVVLTSIVRWSSWPLFVLIVFFFVTGYAMSGEFGFGGLLDAKRALALHRMCHLPLIALTLIHSLAAMWLALRRWGWLGR